MKSDFLTLDEIHKEEIKILDIVNKYFEKNNIDYSIYYGTLLGAIRHNGFIPWDDDIDLAILRENYNKLLECLIRDNFIIDKDNNIEAIGFELGNSIWPFIKIVNKNIEIIDDFKCDKNLWIDVFPLDNIIDNNKFYYFILSIYRKIYYIKRDAINNISTNKLKTKIARFLLSGMNFNFFLNKYIKYCKKYENINTNKIAKNVWGRNTICLKNKFITSVGNFDKVKIHQVIDYDYFLKVLYGHDYMDVPPKEKQISHLFKARYISEKIFKVGDDF